MGFMGIGEGLILGFICGQILVVCVLSYKIWKEDKGLFYSISLSNIRKQSRRYVNFPKYSVASGLIQSTASQLHIILISIFFGSSIVGYLSLTQRVIRLPMTLVTNSVANVFKQRASYYFVHENNCKDFFLKTMKGLIAISILPLLVFLPLAPDLFDLVFGSSWRMSGVYAQIMAVMFFMRFIVSPLSGMFMIAEKQKYDLVMQTFLLLTTFVSLSLGYYIFHDSKIAIALFVLSYCVKYCMEFIMSYKFSKGKAEA